MACNDINFKELEFLLENDFLNFSKFRQRRSQKSWN